MASIFGNSLSQRPESANESDRYYDLTTGDMYVFAENAWHKVPWTGTVIPVATTTKSGTVKMAANVAAVTPAGDVATDCETKVNAILTALKAAGIMVADA